jgi:hypothetical protein
MVSKLAAAAAVVAILMGLLYVVDKPDDTLVRITTRYFRTKYF